MTVTIHMQELRDALGGMPSRITIPREGSYKNIISRKPMERACGRDVAERLRKNFGKENRI